ncbi:hypothetical protein BS50DRAFT_628375 [Corynespora cassiicola Philippines]|uniref:Uncharacterized protein n=1 Tax=Corynespora cassiicola Philippines TaxID=1448308 RepID=A0A2T2PBX1_CORCC|nr:hypothetical protein BS50DRAFT_628375 [Corynespora cassiicola Philippines]
MAPPTTYSDASSPYTPTQIKHVLLSALSPLPSSPLSFGTGYDSDSSSCSDGEPPRTLLWPMPRNLSNDDSPTYRANRRQHHQQYESPVRPSPVQSKSGQEMFEVESGFLQAMVGLLERQAKIVPEFMLTEGEVRGIVGEEVGRLMREIREEGKSEVKDEGDRGEDVVEVLSKFFTTSRILGVGAAAAGLLVGRRAVTRHSKEAMGYLMEGAKGGVAGLIGVLVIKHVLRRLERLGML